MPKLTKKTDDGRTLTVETDLPAEIQRLKYTEGFHEVKSTSAPSQASKSDTK